MEEGESHWSLKRWRMYKACPRQYKYHYCDSHLAYKEDCKDFHRKLYERRHESSSAEVYRDSLYSALGLLFSEGHRSNQVNESFHNELYRSLQDYPEADRESYVDKFYAQFGEAVSSIMKLQEFSWLTPQKHYLYLNDFVSFTADGGVIDLYLPLTWRDKGEINLLRISQSEIRQKVVDLDAYYFYKIYGNEIGRFTLWNLIGKGNSWYIKKKKATSESLVELRDLIMNTTSLLNNWQNDFPFSENMALCQACKYFSLCEKFENQGFK